ncbi:paraquat-inducible protein A [Bordetella genomosp. 13]|uniref:Paraquat-inducible membrane protein A n=1 Tax=Bordetella genomosp. 13 TaxID=463040 RepID=A0A1W6Z995_9BORD|nr:paraquat-inducible protein A [Bordetella genomosp. 13]ARP93812.1 paraquat-inducible membrane protein A [Bordetella genomosp. 13]
MGRGCLIACHECDLLLREVALPPGGTARCPRCGAHLYRDRPDSLNRALAFALAALVLFATANAFPIVGLNVNGEIVQATLLRSVQILYRDGMWSLAGLVLVTTIVMPLLEMLATLYLLVPLRLRRLPPRPEVAFRGLHLARTWGMTEVLILGILVALVKLTHLAIVIPGMALWTFGATMVLLAATAAAFDQAEVWSHIAARRTEKSTEPRISGAMPTAARAGLMVCHECGLLQKAAAHDPDARCPRCAARVHVRTPGSIPRTWAFLVAALVLYVPANVLPVMDTSSLFGAQSDTIMSGVVYLWTSGSWLLAVVVFIASIAVPMLKILALAYLVVAAQRHSRSLLLERARIYRLVEFVGRWSMLDIYVITVLVALVQFSALATIKAGPAAIAFGAVVVLTIIAARSFDPRLTWDGTEKRHG